MSQEEVVHLLERVLSSVTAGLKQIDNNIKEMEARK